ncbi:MAG: alcohol dehydrogenase [Caldilineae bacterium]|nr:MAG: alcohol dehydrogenase [Caldilineae bacterium]
MKAIGFYEHGDIDKLQFLELPRPEPARGEVLINVKAVALNHLDLWVLGGLPALKLEMPHIGGSDIAGLIAGLGDGVVGLQVGQRVVVNPTLSCGNCAWCRRGEDSLCDEFGVIGEHCRGGAAEYVVVPARNVMPMPDDFSFIEAAAVPLVFLTAWRALITRGQLRPGESVLILGASGGVASAAIQIARLAGATVYAVTSSPDKMEKARALGADWVVDRTQENWSSAVYNATNRQGVDLVLENVGAATWFDSLRSARKGGRIVTYGATSGPRPQTDIRYIFWKQLTILGTTMSTRSEFDDVMNLVWQGKLKPVVDSVFPMEEAHAAYRRLQAGEQFGKVVIEIG